MHLSGSSKTVSIISFAALGGSQFELREAARGGSIANLKESPPSSNGPRRLYLCELNGHTLRAKELERDEAVWEDERLHPQHLHVDGGDDERDGGAPDARAIPGAVEPQASRALGGDGGHAEERGQDEGAWGKGQVEDEGHVRASRGYEELCREGAALLPACAPPLLRCVHGSIVERGYEPPPRTREGFNAPQVRGEDEGDGDVGQQ